MPEFVKRIEGADVARGAREGGYHVWPAARPGVTLDVSERLAFSLRLRPDEGEGGELQLQPGGPGVRLRRETNGSGFWLDVEIGPFEQAGTYRRDIVLTHGAGGARLTIPVTVNVVAESLTVTPRELDFGEVSLADLRSGAAKSLRAGIRKQVGAFRVRSVSSTLPFVSAEAQALVEGSNYVVRARLTAESLPRAGSYTGALIVETDDPHRPRLEIPLRIRLVE